jgi:hypothetical protein
MSGGIIGGKWVVQELVAVMWNDGMAQRFPSADHVGCRQLFQHKDGQWVEFDPPRCVGWHCNRCGAPTNSWGHHDCPDRPVMP